VVSLLLVVLVGNVYETGTCLLGRHRSDVLRVLRSQPATTLYLLVDLTMLGLVVAQCK
jgi:hypothetical protein